MFCNPVFGLIALILAGALNNLTFLISHHLRPYHLYIAVLKLRGSARNAVPLLFDWRNAVPQFLGDVKWER